MRSKGQIRIRVFQIKAFCIAVLMASLLTPDLPLLGGLPAIRIDDLLLILSPLYLSVVAGRIILDLRILVLGLITLLIIFAILYGAVLGLNAAMGDLFFVVRIAKYIGALVLGLGLIDIFESQEHAIRWFLKKFVVIGIGLCIIIIQQYFDFFGLNAHYVQFVAPTQYDTLVGGHPWPRPVGMVGNPNEVGFLLGLLGLSSVWLFITETSSRYRWGWIGAIYFGMMLLTMSRSSAVSILFGLTLMVLIFGVSGGGPPQKGGEKKLRMKALSTLFLLAVAAQSAILLTDIKQQVLWRFSKDYMTKAAEVRWANWSENIDLIEESPIIGVGTLKRSGLFTYAADNEWLLLTRIGGLGLPLLVATLFLACLLKSKGAFARRSRPLILSISCAAFIYMIPAALFFNIILMPLVLMILVLAAPRPIAGIRVSG